VEHLLLGCQVAKDCRNSIGLTVSQSPDLFQILEDFKAQLNVPFFMEIIIVKLEHMGN
jgi:hypothetical protein